MSAVTKAGFSASHSSCRIRRVETPTRIAPNSLAPRRSGWPTSSVRLSDEYTRATCPRRGSDSTSSRRAAGGSTFPSRSGTECTTATPAGSTTAA